MSFCKIFSYRSRFSKVLLKLAIYQILFLVKGLAFYSKARTKVVHDNVSQNFIMLCYVKGAI